jgi:hypothetical protein
MFWKDNYHLPNPILSLKGLCSKMKGFTPSFRTQQSGDPGTK